MKRRKRQGLSLYSNDSNHPTTCTVAATSSTQPFTVSNATKLDYHNQNHYPLPSLHTGSSYSHSSSFHTFPSHQPTSSLYITPLNSKPCCTTFSFPDVPIATPLVNIDGLNFPAQFNSSSCQIFHTPLDKLSTIPKAENPSSIFSTKMELPSNQISQVNGFFDGYTGSKDMLHSPVYWSSGNTLLLCKS